jgi:hypothetical protein
MSDRRAPVFSVRDSARHSWHAEFRARALVRTPDRDLTPLLDWLRSRDAFYGRRLAGVRRWADSPVLEKEDIARVPVAADAGPLYELRTSGTSGHQVVVFNDETESSFRKALVYRSFEFCDLPRVVRQVVFADIDGDREVPRDNCLDTGRRRYWQWVLSASASPESQLEALRRVRPHLITSFPSALVRLALAVSSIGLADLRLVSPCGEFLDREWRAILEQGYGVPVLDRYGATESGAIAWECPFCRAYHANADEMYIEPGPGGVVLTPFFLRAQPLLRYRLADRISWAPDSPDCPIRLPNIRIREGRRDDWLYDGRGRKVSPLAFQFEHFRDLITWKVHQSENGTVILFVTWRGALSPGSRRELEREVVKVVRRRRVEVQPSMRNCPATGKFKRVSCSYDPD